MSARVIPVDDPDEVVDVFCEAFRDYPVIRFVLGPERVDSERDLRTLIGLFVMARALRGEYLLGVRGPNAVLEAAATVSRPGAPVPGAFVALREEVWSELGPEARARYEAYCAQQAAELPALLPREGVRALYRAARSRVSGDVADPLALLIEECEGAVNERGGVAIARPRECGGVPREADDLERDEAHGVRDGRSFARIDRGLREVAEAQVGAGPSDQRVGFEVARTEPLGLDECLVDVRDAAVSPVNC